jgi:hypothetical protein
MPTTPSSIIWRGSEHLATLLEDVPAQIEFNEDGIASATLAYSCLWENAADLVGQITRHPDYYWLKRKTATISREEACLARASISFEGVPPQTSEFGEDDASDPTYSLSGDLSTEPIETHPTFADFAGTVNAPNVANGASFVQAGEDRGRFLGFLPKDVANPKAGVRSYLEPALTYSETRVYSNINGSFSGASMNKLGKIDDPPSSKVLPTVSENRSWLLSSCNIESVGDGFKVTRSWRLSGRNGWDEDIYEEEPAP